MDQFPTDPMHPDASVDPASLRAAARDSLMLTAQLRFNDTGVSQQVRIRNLSAGGLMAEYRDPVISGSAITIDVRGVGIVPGRVAWAAEGRIGIAFDVEIDPKLARKPVGSGARTPVYTKPVLPLG